MWGGVVVGCGKLVGCWVAGNISWLRAVFRLIVYKKFFQN